MRIMYTSLCIALLALCGCGKDTTSSEAKEERNPLIKQGHAYMEIKDYAQARTAFLKAIENDPRMARPYLDLATIYHQHKPKNYIRAIFYYERYLELRPDSEKADFIKEQIQKVHQALYQDILTQSGAYQLKAECERLQKENHELKRKLAAQPKSTTETAQQKSVTQTVPKSASPPAAAQSGHRIYTVVAGDNLTRIANKFYGSSEWEPIYEANKDRMKSPGDLREGQTLVIPNR